VPFSTHLPDAAFELTPRCIERIPERYKGILMGVILLRSIGHHNIESRNRELNRDVKYRPLAVVPMTGLEYHPTPNNSVEHPIDLRESLTHLRLKGFGTSHIMKGKLGLLLHGYSGERHVATAG